MKTSKVRKDDKKHKRNEAWKHTEKDERERRETYFKDYAGDRPESEKFIRNKYAQKPIPKEFKGVWIPRKLWLCEELDSDDKAILSQIHFLQSSKDSDGKGAFASNAYFAGFLRCSIRQAERKIRRLVAIGHLKYAKREKAEIKKDRLKHRYRRLIVSRQDFFNKTEKDS